MRIDYAIKSVEGLYLDGDEKGFCSHRGEGARFERRSDAYRCIERTGFAGLRIVRVKTQPARVLADLKTAAAEYQLASVSYDNEIRAFEASCQGGISLSYDQRRALPEFASAAAALSRLSDASYRLNDAARAFGLKLATPPAAAPVPHFSPNVELSS